MCRKIGLGSNIGHGLFVGWVEHPDIFRWVSFLNPTYLPAIFVLSTQPNKMAWISDQRIRVTTNKKAHTSLKV
jgi:hypothetical protein